MLNFELHVVDATNTILLISQPLKNAIITLGSRGSIEAGEGARIWPVDPGLRAAGPDL